VGARRGGGQSRRQNAEQLGTSGVHRETREGKAMRSAVKLSDLRAGWNRQNPGQPLPAWMVEAAPNTSPAQRKRRPLVEKPARSAAQTKLKFREIFPPLPPPSYGPILTSVERKPVVRQPAPVARVTRPAAIASVRRALRVRRMPSYLFGAVGVVT